jgi:hypothetical protein
MYISREFHITKKRSGWNTWTSKFLFLFTIIGLKLHIQKCLGERDVVR